MSRKSFSPAFRAGSSVLGAVSRTGLSQARGFSVSASRQASSVISFSPTSSQELDALLSEIRYKILLPTYIRQEQRKKIFRPRYGKELRSSPITMEIDGDIVKYTGLNPVTEVPNTRRILKQAVGRMETREDWENLPRLLEGLYYNANRRLKSHDYPWMTYKAGEKGCIYTIIDCARQVRKTGFRLDTSEKIQTIMTYLARKAVDSAWDETETRKALAWAEMVLELTEGEEHRVAKTPMGRDPQVLATPLFLAAGLATRHSDGQDVDGKVAKYATLVTKLWPEGKGLLQLHPEAAYRDHDRMHYLVHSKDKLVEVGVPIMHGMQTAAQVVGEPLAGELRSRAEVVAKEVEDALAQAGEDEASATGRTLYKNLYEADKSA